jgi:pimeloyl-ACP methyl ester carboxylesterase
MIRILKLEGRSCRIAIASLFVGVSLYTSGCARVEDTRRAAPVQAGTHMVTVAPNVRLEVMNWGGSGPTMVFLAGLGMTAADFESFASRFRDSFHVYGITRRGFGASSCPVDGYDAATRAHDIIVILDSLHIDRAVLVGHSLGGDELSKIAATVPNRVRALIYLEAYDHPATADNGPLPPPPSRSKLAKMRRTMLADALAHPDDPMLKTERGTEPWEYAKITAPALAIFAGNDMTARQLFDDYDSFDAKNKDMAQRYVTSVQEIRQSSRDRFRAEMRRGTVLVIDGADHFIYRSDGEEVERAMRQFLRRVLYPS